MCSDDGRVEEAITHALIGADETMVSDDEKSASDPSSLLPQFDSENLGGYP